MKASLAAIAKPLGAERFRAAGREALALARHATLLHRDWVSAELPAVGSSR